MRRMGFLALVVATAVTIGCNRSDNQDVRASADSPVGTAGTAADTISSGDRDFLRDVAIINKAEIELGRLAADRGAHAEVKKYGQMMVDDHTNGRGKLDAIAVQHSLQLPTELDDDHMDLRDKLAQAGPGDFDRDYLAAMIDGHEDLLDKLEPRLDAENLAEWRTRMSDKAPGETSDEKIRATAVTPEKSDDLVTMAINQWAADSYPVVYAHLEAAKTLNETVKKRATN